MRAKKTQSIVAPVWGLLAKYGRPSTGRDWDVGGPRDEEIATVRRAGNVDRRKAQPTKARARKAK